jgi:hypothetical protein
MGSPAGFETGRFEKYRQREREQSLTFPQKQQLPLALPPKRRAETLPCRGRAHRQVNGPARRRHRPTSRLSVPNLSPHNNLPTSDFQSESYPGFSASSKVEFPLFSVLIRTQVGSRARARGGSGCHM